MFLRQATASQSREIGPFVDDTDFKTAETALTIANTDVKLSVNGAAGVSKNSGGGTHRNNGMYSLTFDATDTATVGELTGSVNVSGALIVPFKFFVVEEAVYDALFAASAPGFLQPTVAGRTLDVSATGEAGIDWGNIGSATATNNLSATTIATVTNDESGVTTLLTRIGTPNNLGSGASVAANLTDIESQTDDIGSLGAGLTAIPWNSNWDAEVQSEVQDALEATVADSVPADGTRPSIAQAAYMIIQYLTERSVSGTTCLVKKPDGSTTLYTLTLDDGVNPTSSTRS